MDIGTAKPTAAEQAAVPHHMLDVVTPGEYFSVADFQRLATAAIADIQARGNIPLLVGGTGLYIDSVVFGYEFSKKDANKNKAEALSNAELLAELKRLSPEATAEQLARYASNRRHLVGAVAAGGIGQKRLSKPQAGTILVGLNPGRTILAERITARAKIMFQSGVVKETELLAQKYGWSSEAMTGNIYRIIRRVLAKEITLEQAEQLFITSDMQLAKRQMTWFKRNPHITWFESPKQASEFLTTKCMQTP